MICWRLVEWRQQIIHRPSCFPREGVINNNDNDNNSIYTSAWDPDSLWLQQSLSMQTRCLELPTTSSSASLNSPPSRQTLYATSDTAKLGRKRVLTRTRSIRHDSRPSDLHRLAAVRATVLELGRRELGHRQLTPVRDVRLRWNQCFQKPRW